MQSNPVKINESDLFKKKYKQFITDIELEAIRHLLASKPAIGKQTKHYPGLLRLDWRGGATYIFYMVSTQSESLCIHLVAIGSSLPDPDKEEKKKANSVLKILKTLGVGMAIREVIKRLWEIAKETF